MNDNLTRIRYVTANFHGLQGLKLIPFGLFLWSEAALSYLGPQTPWLVESGLTLRSVVALLCVLIYGAIHTYYRRSFGHAERLPANSGERMFWLMTWMLLGFGVLVFFITSAGRGVIENGRLATPFNVLILLMAWLVALRFTTHRHAPADGWSILLGVGMASIALLALLFEVTALQPFRAEPVATAFVMLGVAAMLVGARHHWLLTEAFGTIPEEETRHA